MSVKPLLQTGGRKRWTHAAILAASTIVAAAGAAPALASSHGEAPNITGLPRLDGTDLWMFRSYETNRSNFVTIIANYSGRQDPYAGPNFFTLQPGAFYDIHIDNTGNGVPDMTFRFEFTNTDAEIAVPAGGPTNTAIPLVAAGAVGTPAINNPNLNVHETYTLSLIEGASSHSITNMATGSKVFEKPADNFGENTFADYSTYAAAHIFNINIPGCATAGKVFVGQRKDAFVVNLGSTFDLLNGYPSFIDGMTTSGFDMSGTTPNAANNGGADDLADKNVTTLSLEVPITCLLAKGGLDPVIGAWTTSTFGGQQVSRLGNPLVNEFVIGLKDKDKFNASQPVDDAQFLHYVQFPAVPVVVNTLFGFTVPPTPRSDLVAVFLTGIKNSGLAGLVPNGNINQPLTIAAGKGRPSEMLRLNTSIPVVPATPTNMQNRLGVIGGDLAGYPNGRRPGDDVVDITLRVAEGRVINLLGGNGGTGSVQNFSDGAFVDATFFNAAFPYQLDPLPGSPGAASPSTSLLTITNPVLPPLAPVASSGADEPVTGP